MNLELLPSEFVKLAQFAEVSEKSLLTLLGKTLYPSQKELDNDQVAWRSIPDKEALQIENWKLIEQADRTFELTKIAMRRRIQKYSLFTNRNLTYFTQIGISEHNAVLYQDYKNPSEFTGELTGKYRDIESVDQDLKIIENLTEDEFRVFLALVENFISLYPVPKSDWVPDELLLFTAESLSKTVHESAGKSDSETWWKHWQKLHDSKMPGEKQLETACFTLSQKQLIGYMDDIDIKNVFFVTKNLLWLIRAIAWWDRGFILSDPANNIKLTFIEASSLFVIFNDRDKYFSLFNIGGKELETIILNFLSYDKIREETFDETKETPVPKIKKETEIETKDPSPNFCFQCGKPVLPKAKFCINCGVKLI